MNTFTLLFFIKTLYAEKKLNKNNHLNTSVINNFGQSIQIKYTFKRFFNEENF